MSEDAVDEGEDLLESLGLDSKPLDCNDEFYIKLTEGHYKKIDNMVYWMRGEISKLLYLQEYNVNCTKDVVREGKSITVPLTRLEYGKLMIKYYLQMYHLPSFRNDISGREACNYQIVVDRIVAYPPMKDTIENCKG